MQTPSSDVTSVAVVDRTDPPRSFLNTAWPLVALALLLLLLLRACVPAAPLVAPPQALEPAKATRQAGSAADVAPSPQRPVSPPTSR